MDEAYEKAKALFVAQPIPWTLLIAAGLVAAGWFLREWTLPNQLCIPL